MLTKCICTYCAGHLEFEAENAGEKIVCPHCGFKTTLYLPGTQPVDSEMTGLIRRLVRRRQLIWVAAGVLVCAAIVYALWRWGIPQVQDFLPSVESKVVLWLVLLFGCLAVPTVLFWLVFPIILCCQVRKLTQVIAELVARLVTVTEQPAESESGPESEAASETEFAEKTSGEEPVAAGGESTESTS